MIKVIITGPPSGAGFFPYRIDWWSEGRPQFVGVSKQPLLDACRQLKAYGLMDDTVVGLFDENQYRDEWRLRTTVGYGAKQTIREDAGTGPRMVPFRPMPEHARLERGDVQDALELDAGIPATPEDAMPYREFPGGPLKASPSDATPATPAAPPLLPHTPPKPPAEADQAHPHPHKPAMSAKSHHPPKLKGSSARRGSR